MVRDKRIVTGVVVALILLSFVLYVVIVRRAQGDQQRHARTAVQAWYAHNGHPEARVVSCRLVDLGAKLIDGFSCVVAGACAGERIFLVPQKGSVRLYARRSGC
jgi:hypothetical protein